MTALPGRPLRVFMVAGEESGDQLGGALMEALNDLLPGAVAYSGIGGSRMERAGLSSLFPMEDLTAMGIAAVVSKLGTIVRRLNETVAAILADPPDVLVLVDAPDFTHRVAARVRAKNARIPIVKYVSPTVWIWRPGRARRMAAYVDRLLALLPFEPQVHERLGGPPTLYVGHPLLERLGELRPGPEEALRRAAAPPRVLVLPGSRRRELARLGPDFGAALALVAAHRPMDLVMPTLPRLEAQAHAMIAPWPIKPRIVVGEEEKLAAFRTAHAALAASGTVTLELALAGIPHVAAYRLGWLEAQIARRILQGTTVILPNLVLGENVVPEFLQEYMTPEVVAGALDALLTDSPERRRQVEGFARLDAIFGIAGETPSLRAARAVIAAARPRD